MDELLAEVRRVRDELVAEHGYDLHALCNELRKNETKHQERVVDLTVQKSRQKDVA